MREAIVCARCGAKVRAGQRRCPRCRAHLTAPDPAAVAAASRRLRKAARAITASFVLLTATLWVRQEPATPAAVAVPRSSQDPLATRRPRPAVNLEAGTAAPAARAFLDPAAAGTIAYGNGDYASALEQYTAAVERNPQDAESLSNLGQVLVRLERPREAIPYFERAIAILPERWAYHFNLARAQGLTGNWEQAVAGYRRAQALFPDDYATAFNLGQALHRFGDEAAAVEAYQKAISLEPGEPSFRMALGISYERLDRRAEAAAAYREALRLAPDAPDADRVNDRIAQLTGAGGAAPVPPAEGPRPGGA